MLRKVCVIVRGLPGSGKTEFTNFLNTLSMDGINIFTTDDFFTRRGQYKFDGSKLAEAHKWNFKRFCATVKAGATYVAVANTATREEEFRSYKEFAEKHGYKVYVITVENWHGNKNVHGVPDENLDKMDERYELRLR